MKILYIYPNSIARQEVYQNNKPNSEKEYLLFGRNDAKKYGHTVVDSLSTGVYAEKSKVRKLVNFAINKIWTFLGGCGGDWYKVFLMRKKIKKADVVVATAGRVGIPLALMKYWRLIRQKPIIYMSIGLPERLEALNGPMAGFCRKALREKVEQFVCYGYREHQKIQDYLSLPGDRVHFLPFGVDIDYFCPLKNQQEDDYIISVGADGNRDFDLLLQVAEKVSWKILIVTTNRRLNELKQNWNTFPHNVDIRINLPFKQMKILMESARFVVLPLHDNSYSGATTTLLQAMALAKPVIVSKTGAIEQGYHLQHNRNVIFTEPGNLEQLHKELERLWDNAQLREDLGKSARKTVTKHLSWDYFIKNLYSIISRI